MTLTFDLYVAGENVSVILSDDVGFSGVEFWNETFFVLRIYTASGNETFYVEIWNETFSEDEIWNGISFGIGP